MRHYIYNGIEWVGEDITYYWKQHKINVIFDGHNPITGQRLEVVVEDLPEPMLIANALVVSEAYFKENFKELE